MNINAGRFCEETKHVKGIDNTAGNYCLDYINCGGFKNAGEPCGYCGKSKVELFCEECGAEALSASGYGDGMGLFRIFIDYNCEHNEI